MTGARPIRVLHVTPAFMPAYEWGGPVFSTHAICQAIAASDDFELEVLTTNAASPNNRRALPLEASTVNFPAGYKVHYSSRRFGASGSPEMLMSLSQRVRWADLVHLSFTYSFPTLPTLAATRLWGKPLVWSPRGALQATDEWADVPRKRLKTGFEALCRMIMSSAVTLHVTAESERTASLHRLPRVKTSVIPNGVDIPTELPPRGWRPDGRLRLVFLSRLHEKKGLDQLIAAMRELPPHITLDIYGSGTPTYEEEIDRLIALAGLGDRIRIHGHVDGVNKQRAFALGDLFVLPTRSENFGIAIAEALAHGLPVITTTAAPWGELEARDCGLWINESRDALIDAIRHMDTLEGQSLAAMGVRGRAWMQSSFASDKVGLQMLDLYRTILREHDTRG